MTEHPWTELQLLIKEKWLTQKAFSAILWKKVSEVNELLKWKRNITIQWDYLLHQTLWTPIKYWILKQVDYDYSLIDIEDYKNPPLLRGDAPEELGGFKDSPLDNKEGVGEIWNSEPKEHENPSSTKPMDFSLQSKWQTEPQKSPIQEPDPKDDEDFKKRARIFKSF